MAHKKSLKRFGYKMACPLQKHQVKVREVQIVNSEISQLKNEDKYENEFEDYFHGEFCHLVIFKMFSFFVRNILSAN